MTLIFFLNYSITRISSIQFNITSYTKHLPSDLRESVATALTIERQSYQSTDLWKDTSCNVNNNITCPPSKYRNPTGKCNNIRHSNWGNRGTPFLRLLPPQYLDGK